MLYSFIAPFRFVSPLLLLQNSLIFFIYLKAINDNLVVVMVVPEQLIGGCLLSAPSLFLIVCLFATSVQSFMFFVCVFLLSGGY